MSKLEIAIKREYFLLIALMIPMFLTFLTLIPIYSLIIERPNFSNNLAYEWYQSPILATVIISLINFINYFRYSNRGSFDSWVTQMVKSVDMNFLFAITGFFIMFYYFFEFDTTIGCPGSNWCLYELYINIGTSLAILFQYPIVRKIMTIKNNIRESQKELLYPDKVEFTITN